MVKVTPRKLHDARTFSKRACGLFDIIVTTDSYTPGFPVTRLVPCDSCANRLACVLCPGVEVFTNEYGEEIKVVIKGSYKSCDTCELASCKIKTLKQGYIPHYSKREDTSSFGQAIKEAIGQAEVFLAKLEAKEW